MRFLKCFLLVLFLSEIIICAKAQDKPLTIYDRIIVEKDSIAQVGKLYRLTFKYTTKDPRERLYYLKWDNDGGDFDIITGPSHSFISSKQNVDGSLIDTYTDSYTYSILFNKEGVFAIPPMSAKNRRGNSIASDSIIVVVKKRQEKNLEANVHSPNDILDVEVSVNKTQIELGDSIECEIRFYTNLNLNQYKIHTNLLADNSFWKVHDVSETEWKIKEEYKAQKVQTLLASKYTLHPL